MLLSRGEEDVRRKRGVGLLRIRTTEDENLCNEDAGKEESGFEY